MPVKWYMHPSDSLSMAYECDKETIDAKTNSPKN